MQAKVALELIGRPISLCMYISMEAIVGADTGLLIFITVFSTMS